MAQPNQSTESTVNERGKYSQEAGEYVESIRNSQFVYAASTAEEPSLFINRKRNLSNPVYTSINKAKSDRQWNDSKDAEIQGDIGEELEDS